MQQSARTYLRLEARFFIMLCLCLVFYFIASNIGSGWIYLLSSAILTALIIGLILPFWQVREIKVTQDAPRQFVAGQTAIVSITLSPSKYLVLHWLHVGYDFKAASQSQDTTRDITPHLVVNSLEKKQTVAWPTSPLKRGVHLLGTVVISSSFPLGLAWWNRRIAARKAQTITVYPKVLPVDGSFIYRLRSPIGSRGGLARSTENVRQSTSTRGVREYVRGDSPRHVHWASSARTGRLLVREFEAEGLPLFDVLLDLTNNWTTREQFELAVVTASSLLTLGHKLGIGPQLRLKPEVAELALNLPSTPPGIASQMEILARVEPTANPHIKPQFTRGGYDSPQPGKALIVIQPLASTPTLSPFCYLIEIDDVALARTRKALVPGLGRLASTDTMRCIIRCEEDLSAI